MWIKGVSLLRRLVGDEFMSRECQANTLATWRNTFRRNGLSVYTDGVFGRDLGKVGNGPRSKTSFVRHCSAGFIGPARNGKIGRVAVSSLSEWSWFAE